MHFEQKSHKTLRINHYSDGVSYTDYIVAYVPNSLHPTLRSALHKNSNVLILDEHASNLCDHRPTRCLQLSPQLLHFSTYLRHQQEKQRVRGVQKACHHPMHLFKSDLYPCRTQWAKPSLAFGPSINQGRGGRIILTLAALAIPGDRPLVVASTIAGR